MSLTDYAAVVIAIVLAVLALGGAIELYGKHKDLERRVDRLEGQNENRERGSDGDSIYENWDRSDAHIAPYHVLDVQAAYQAGCGRCLYLLDRVNTAFTGALGEQDRADNQEWQTLYEELEEVNRELQGRLDIQTRAHDKSYVEQEARNAILRNQIAEMEQNHEALREAFNDLSVKHNNLRNQERLTEQRWAEDVRRLDALRERIGTNGKTPPPVVGHQVDCRCAYCLDARGEKTMPPLPDDWNEIMQEKLAKKPKRVYTRRSTKPAPVLESLLD